MELDTVGTIVHMLFMFWCAALKNTGDQRNRDRVTAGGVFATW